MSTKARHRSRHPYRGPREGHRRSSTTTTTSSTPSCTSSSSADSRNSSRGTLLGGPDADAAHLRHLLRQSSPRGAKVLDDIDRRRPGVRAVRVTPTALKIRRLGHYAQMLQSHVTAYFYLVVPEMMFGMDARTRAAQSPRTDRGGPRAGASEWSCCASGVRKCIEAVFGKRMHGISSVPGGVNKSLTAADVDRLLRGEDGLLSVDRGHRLRAGRSATLLRLSREASQRRSMASRMCPRSTCLSSTPTATWTTTTAS